MLSHRIGKFALSAVAAAVSVALPLAVITESAQAAQCYGYVAYKAEDHYSSKRIATDAAISGWQIYVAHQYGKSYAYWSHAAYRSVKCSEYDYYWTCTANAQPCYWAPSYKPSYKKYYKKNYGGSSGY